MKLGTIGSYSVQRINNQVICSEVLPSIKKGGVYITKAKAIELFGLIDNDEAEALRKINNPKGETKLHYDVATYIKRNYSHVLITPGLREVQITHFSRLDSKAMGYRKDQPDLGLSCKRW